MSRVLFVGERRSETAIRRGWTWEDGHLAAKQLFDALDALAFERKRIRFVNLFEKGGHDVVVRAMWARWPIIAMGRKVQAALNRELIKHVELVHPAARGRVRNKQRYTREVARALAEAGVL